MNLAKLFENLLAREIAYAFLVALGPCLGLMAIALVACTGSTDSAVHVSPPSITRQPTNQTVTAGQTATFTIVATGTAPLIYRWQKGGVNIAGATSSSYTTAATTAADNGSKFDVMVSNSAASVTSNAATLTVNDHASTGPKEVALRGKGVSPTPLPTAAVFGHVAILVEENTNYSSVTSSSMPYLFGLMTQYGLATKYYANTHPSIGNYFMLTTGQILTTDNSQTPSSLHVSVDNVVRELVAAGKTWKAYAESLPSVGYLGADTNDGGGQYYVRHVPIAYLTDVQNSSAQQQNLVPFTQLAQDLSTGSLPNYSFITPNGCDDADDCGLSTADNWLKNNIDRLIKNSVFQKDGLLIIVLDESSNDNTGGGGRVVCALISPAFSRLGYQSNVLYQHERYCASRWKAWASGCFQALPSVHRLCGSSLPSDGQLSLGHPRYQIHFIRGSPLFKGTSRH